MCTAAYPKRYSHSVTATVLQPQGYSHSVTATALQPSVTATGRDSNLLQSAAVKALFAVILSRFPGSTVGR